MKMVKTEVMTAELADGTRVEVTMVNGAPTTVRAAKLGTGPDAPGTESLDLPAVPFEWFERVAAASDKLLEPRRKHGDVCPDHGRFVYNYARPAGSVHRCPTCEPDPADAEPATLGGEDIPF